MWTRPAFLIILKIKFPIRKNNHKTIFIPFPLFALYPLVDSLDDIIMVLSLFAKKKNNNLGIVIRAIKVCSVGLRAIMINLMGAGKLDLVNIDVNSDSDKVEVKVLLR